MVRPVSPATAMRHMKRLGEKLEAVVTEAKRLGYDGLVLFALRPDDASTSIYRACADDPSRLERTALNRRLERIAGERFTAAADRRQRREERAPRRGDIPW